MATNVSFNDDQMALYEELKSKKVISQTFAEFVKSTFHEKVDRIRTGIRGVDLSHKTIENLTFEKTKKQTEANQ